eukprot:8175471-Karenia_brevis.AAC.1
MDWSRGTQTLAQEQLWCPKIIALAARPEEVKVEAADDRGYQLQRGDHSLAPSQLRGGKNTGGKGGKEMADCVGQDLKRDDE